MAVAQARAVAAGKGEKMELVFDYLTGTQFRQRVEAVVEAFSGLRADLEREKLAMQRLWASRDRQIKGALSSTAGMYGDIQGIVGASLPKIASLELDALPEPDGED